MLWIEEGGATQYPPPYGLNLNLFISEIMQKRVGISLIYVYIYIYTAYYGEEKNTVCLFDAFQHQNIKQAQIRRNIRIGASR